MLMLWCTHGGQRTAHGSSSLVTLWVLAIKLRLAGLVAGILSCGPPYWPVTKFKMALYILDNGPLSDVLCKYFLQIYGLPFTLFSVYW